jgi:hypothetical protein
VAEYQPSKQNRMNTELASFAARLRERIFTVAAGMGSPGPDQTSIGASSRRLLPDEEFNTLALELFALQFTHNDAYRRLGEARGVRPASITHRFPPCRRRRSRSWS